MFLKPLILSFLLLSGLLCQGQVTIVIESLPAATPSTDTIFITGSFNNWVPNDKTYQVHRLLNGQMGITLPFKKGHFEYKFTRGSWMKVETDHENRYTGNRSFTAGANSKIYTTVENWLDLGGAHLPGYSMLFFFGAGVLAIVLFILVMQIQKADKSKRLGLELINATLAIMFGCLVLTEIVNPILQSYLNFFLQLLLFVWPPLILLMLTNIASNSSVKIWPYFIPAGLVLIFNVFRLFNVAWLDPLSVEVLPSITLANSTVIGLSILYNSWIHWRMSRLEFIRANVRGDKKLSLFKYIYLVSAAALAMMWVNAILIYSLHDHIDEISLVAPILSCLIFVESYYLWRYPDIVREERPLVATEPVAVDWLDRLNAIMREQKPYRNPELNVSDLAEIMGIKAHALSRGINDHFQKNFRDFVNSFRIEEFIVLADKKEFKHYTFLALAQEVGFNSKSTFNLAFKKVTDMSPRDYFKNRVEVVE